MFHHCTVCTTSFTYCKKVLHCGNNSFCTTTMIDQVSIPVIISFDERKKTEWSVYKKYRYFISSEFYVDTYKNLTIIYGYINTSKIDYFNKLTKVLYNQCATNNYFEFFVHLELAYKDYLHRLKSSPYYVPLLNEKRLNTNHCYGFCSNYSNIDNNKLQKNGKTPLKRMKRGGDDKVSIPVNSNKNIGDCGGRYCGINNNFDLTDVAPVDDLRPLSLKVQELITIIQKTFTNEFFNKETLDEINKLHEDVCIYSQKCNAEILLASNHIMYVLAGLEYYYMLGNQKKLIKNVHIEMEKQQQNCDEQQNQQQLFFDGCDNDNITNLLNESRRIEVYTKIDCFEQKQLMMMYSEYLPYKIAPSELKEKMFTFLKDGKKYLKIY